METKQNYNGDIKTEMEELQKLELTVESVSYTHLGNPDNTGTHI